MSARIGSLPSPCSMTTTLRREGPPVLWETMIFGGGVTDEEYQERFTSVEDARDGHERAIELARQWASKAVRENEEGL